MPCQCFLIDQYPEKLFPIMGSDKVIENRKKENPFICFKDQTGLQILALNRKGAFRNGQNTKR